jgi:pimeloyl-ACP methyl ester carboxylesterase
MSAISLSPKRRELLAATVAAAAISMLPGSLRAGTGDESIRPFTAKIPQEDITELRRRIATTRWADRETVPDRSQGVQLTKLQDLVRYWGTSYDWRKGEAKLNAYPQFVTEIDGLDIHFIHFRSPHANALPLIMTHGWPGSVFELLKTIGPLAEPTAYGGRAEDAFHLVLPSMPGYGFSAKPRDTGWGPDRIALAWTELMKRLGYTRYVAQGGDWGSPVSSAMARQAPPGLLGIHINLPATVPPEVAAVLAIGGPAPPGLSERERAAFDSLDTFYKMRRAYAAMMGTRPQVVGQALSDSPAGLAAFMYDYNDGEPERLLTKDDFLDNVTLYWLTNSATSSARLYWETAGQSVLLSAAQKTSEISLPVAITVFPEEVYRAPETWARRAYRNLAYFNEVDKGGHFAAWEQPALLAAELRAAFRPLRPVSRGE